MHKLQMTVIVSCAVAKKELEDHEIHDFRGVTRATTHVIFVTVSRRISFIVMALAWEVLLRFLTSVRSSLAFFCSTLSWL